MRVRACVHACVHVHACVYVHACMCIHTCVHACVCACTHVCVHVCVRAHMRVCGLSKCWGTPDAFMHPGRIRRASPPRPSRTSRPHHPLGPGHSQGLEATEAAEHAPVHRLQLVPREHQLLHARGTVEGALSHFLDLIVAQVSGERGQDGSGQTRGGLTHPAASWRPQAPLE